MSKLLVSLYRLLIACPHILWMIAKIRFFRLMYSLRTAWLLNGFQLGLILTFLIVVFAV